MLSRLTFLRKEQKKAIVFVNDIFHLAISFNIFLSFAFGDIIFQTIIFLFVILIYSIFMEFFGGFAEVLKDYTTDRLIAHAIPIALVSTFIMLFYFYETNNSFMFFNSWIGLRNIGFAALSFAAASFTSITFSRILAKLLIYGRSVNINATKVFIFGIGDSARSLFSIYSDSDEYEIIGFITFDKNNQNRTLYGRRIISYKKAIKLFNKNNKYTVFLALDSNEADERANIINDLSNLAITVKSIPSYSEYLEKDHLKLSELSAADILGRKENRHENKEIVQFFCGKKVLVTGAGGSIGSELSKILARMNANVVLVDSNEYNLYSLQEYFSKYKQQFSIDFKLADIRDNDRMKGIFEDFKPEVVFHAAAYKHVPILETNNNFSEAIKTNIFGTMEIVKLANDHCCERFIFVSTDKAVRPTNLMGASKRLAERFIATFSNDSKTIYSSVRFGNVLKSSGSVIPKFKDQIESGGPVTVTDKNMTRYFMTINEAANLVINASLLPSSYSTFLLKMGDPVKIYDLAKKMINLYGFDVKEENNDTGIEILFTGLRPGEKIYEELLVSGNEQETKNNLIFEDSSDSVLKEDSYERLVKDLKTLIAKDDIETFKKICSEHAEYSEKTNS